MNRILQAVAAGAAALIAVGVVYVAFQWTVNMIYVPEGSNLLLRYKGPLVFGSRKMAPPDRLAEDGEIGVQERLRGPGRHFYCPIWWERELVPDQVVRPGEVAVVVSKVGKTLPSGRFLVDGDLDGANRATEKGTLRKVFGPGRYRVNPYAFEFKTIQEQIQKVGESEKHSGWVEIPTGYVGVVTRLADEEVNAGGHTKGIQEDVLPPGLYTVNPRAMQIDIVAIGYWETSIETRPVVSADGSLHVDESGEPMAVADSGITFPSNDGQPIQLDFTAVWGIKPADAPNVVRTFGTVKQAEQKVIIPQCESICRNSGSRMKAVELLVGETRQQFQDNVSESFETVLEDKNLSLLYGLVRHIYIPREVRVPIQNGYIADELTLTREQEKVTAKTEATLREAERKVELESERVRQETLKLTAEALAEGQRQAAEIDAETEQLVAAIERQAAELDSQRSIVLTEAETDVQKLSETARADRFRLAVEAFGDPMAYNRYQFAEGLPETIDLKLFYAGQGTLWTDLGKIMPTLALPTEAGPAPPTPRTSPAGRPATPAATTTGRTPVR